MDSDTQVSQALIAEIKMSPTLYYAQLGVHVKDGVVTISGRVNSLAERKAVERAARRVAGVSALFLEIRAAAIPVTVLDAYIGRQRTLME